MRLAERDEVAEPLGAGEDLQEPAVVLGEVVAEEVRLGQAGALEVEVVEDGVLDPRLGQGRGQVLLPDPLGDPDAPRGLAEGLAEVGGVVADLPDPVAPRDHRQDRLVEAPAEDLDPPGLGQRPDAGDVLGVPLDEPLQQRPRGVQDERDLGIPSSTSRNGR